VVHRTSIVIVIGFAVVGQAFGCGSGDDKFKAQRPEVATAKGVVTYKGRPVEGATIVFAPRGGATAATGRTDSSGRFSVSAFPPDAGAVPGNYTVTISKTEELPQTAPASHDAPADVPRPRSLIPEKYSVAESSGLTATVPEDGTSDLTFELTD
jgi:hypothetical protein